MSGLLAAIIRTVRYWRELNERRIPDDGLGYLSHDSFAFWLTRIERQERNGTMRRD